MKKQELEQLLEQRNNEISQLHAKIFALQKQLEQSQTNVNEQIYKA